MRLISVVQTSTSHLFFEIVGGGSVRRVRALLAAASGKTRFGGRRGVQPPHKTNIINVGFSPRGRALTQNAHDQILGERQECGYGPLYPCARRSIAYVTTPVTET